MIVREPVVFIVDDDEAVRDSLTLMLKQAGVSVQSFENAQAFMNAYRPDFFGCLIIDVQMPEINGFQLQEELSRCKVALPIIFLTGHGDIPMSVKAIKAGAMDFLTKPVIRERVLICVQAAFAEAEKRFNEIAQSQETRLCLTKLTEREREITALAVKGYSNKEIASRLAISHRTVEIHKSKIMQKTGAINLLDLARITRESDWNEEFYSNKTYSNSK